MKLKPILLTASLALFSFSAKAQIPPNPAPFVLLGWTASASPPALVAAYEVHWGGASGNYTNFVTTTNTVVGITNFVRGQGPYFFVCVTVGTGGTRSVPSNEVSWSPDPLPLPPTNERVVSGH